MPWDVGDVDKFKKGLTDKAKRQWVAIANAALARCREEGGTDCDRRAVIRANGAVEESMAEQEKQEAALQEAVTIKAQAKQLLRAAKALLSNKSLPAALRDDLDAVELALRRTWDDLQAEMDAEDAAAEPEPEPEARADDKADDKAEPEAQPEAEAADMEVVGDVIALHEGVVRKDGTVTVKVIQPGWGSSGYYPADVLARDGKIFAKGTKMFWDHATQQEEAERPEGRLDALAGEFVTDAAWDEQGKAGPGLYADAKVFGRYRDAVAELAPHIGVSIRAMGKAKEGEAEGRHGPLIQSFTAARSVDFVTQPGAGGQIVGLFEAARQAREERQVTEEQAAKLAAENEALRGEVQTLRQALVMREATEYVVAELGKYDLPQAAQERLTEALAGNPPIKDGALDQEAYQTQIEARAKAELEYIEAVAPKGQIKGLGNALAPKPAKDALRESYRSFFIKSGKSPEEADKLADIAAQGR